MDKDNIINSSSHSISITDRKSIIISGVKKIDSFDNEEFLLETTMGYIIINGNDLEIMKLDTNQGNVAIKGKLNNFSYMENSKKVEKEESFFSKLFK